METYAEPFQTFAEENIPCMFPLFFFLLYIAANCDQYLGFSPQATLESDQMHIRRAPNGFPIMPTWNVDTPRSFKDVKDLLVMFMDHSWGKQLYT
jgi:hypothetical protein